MLLLGWLSILLGGVYPLILTGFAHLGWSDAAQGSQLIKEGQVRGSIHLGQGFKSDRYFWPRPSASNYATLPSRGAEINFMNSTLRERMVKKQDTLPADLLLDSASGLDPDITLATALFQVDRVAKARGMLSEEDRKTLISLVMQAKVQKPLNLFGRDSVNVLLLNHSLDTLPSKEKP